MTEIVRDTSREIDVYTQSESIRERLARSRNLSVYLLSLCSDYRNALTFQQHHSSRYMRARKEYSPRRFQSSRLQRKSKVHKMRDFPVFP